VFDLMCGDARSSFVSVDHRMYLSDEYRLGFAFSTVKAWMIEVEHLEPGVHSISSLSWHKHLLCCQHHQAYVCEY